MSIEECKETLCKVSLKPFAMQGSQLTEDDYADVLDALWAARVKWYNIGVRFKIKPSDLDPINMEMDVDTKLQKMIRVWLNSGRNCTWKAVVEALSHHTVDMLKVAKEHSDFLKDKCERGNG